MKLYTWPTPDGQKPLIMLEELGVECYRKWVDITRGEQRAPKFLSLNPLAEVPVLVDHGVVVFESNAILTYLAELTGRFLPLQGAARYETILWTYFQAARVGPAMEQAFLPPEDAARALDEVRRLFAIADAHLADRRYFAADAYTIADMALFPWMRGAPALGLDWDDFPNVARWRDRVGAREAVQRAIHLSPDAG